MAKEFSFGLFMFIVSFVYLLITYLRERIFK